MTPLHLKMTPLHLKMTPLHLKMTPLHLHYILKLEKNTSLADYAQSCVCFLYCEIEGTEVARPSSVRSCFVKEPYQAGFFLGI